MEQEISRRMMQRMQCLEKLFPKPFGTVIFCWLQISLAEHLAPQTFKSTVVLYMLLLNTALQMRWNLQTTHAVGLWGLFLAFYIFLDYLDFFKGVPEKTSKFQMHRQWHRKQGLQRAWSTEVNASEPDRGNRYARVIHWIPTHFSAKEPFSWRPLLLACF